MLRAGPSEILGVNAKDFFFSRNPLISEKIAACEESKSDEILIDVEFAEKNSGESASGNLSFLPLMNQDPDGRMDQVDDYLGTLIMIEDISDEKRMKSTMSRYIDPGIADKLMGEGADIMGGRRLLPPSYSQMSGVSRPLQSRLVLRARSPY